MRKLTNALAIASVAMLASYSTTSDAHDVPYGPAGCGLGHMLMGNDAGIMQILAATTNGIVANQAFGITTGTLGCDVGGGSGGAQIFIESNREAVAKDVARGAGETIANLSQIGECSNSEVLGTYLQSNFDQIFSDATVSDHVVGERIVDLMETADQLNCTGLDPA